jgi:uncharacterized protein (TIGR01777 family)
VLRTALVLGRGGGALARMLPAFESGLGGPVGSGQQYLPWIHLHDLVKIIAVALVDDRYRGAVNGVAPEQTTSRTFARALGRAVGRPARLRVPARALKAIFGQAATVLLASQRVEPRMLREHQFAFDFPTVDPRSRTLSPAPPSRSRLHRRDPSEPNRRATSCEPRR